MSAAVRITPEIVAEHGLTPDEYKLVLEIMGREPSMTELGIFSVMWSEHCSYKSSRVWLKKLPEWELEKKHIERLFEFDEFSEAIDFVNSVAEIAEEEEHHPDIDIRFNKVRLVLTSHNKGGLTERDFELAEKIDNLAE